MLTKLILLFPSSTAKQNPSLQNIRILVFFFTFLFIAKFYTKNVLIPPDSDVIIWLLFCRHRTFPLFPPAAYTLETWRSWFFEEDLLGSVRVWRIWRMLDCCTVRLIRCRRLPNLTRKKSRSGITIWIRVLLFGFLEKSFQRSSIRSRTLISTG